MNAMGSIFAGLYGYECLMLICGFVLFVFTLAAIALMLAQRRSFKALVVLLLVSVVLMGFPGIAAVKFSKDSWELIRIRSEPPPTDPAQQRQARQVLGNLEHRAAGNPQLQAKVADGYRAIGEVDKAYRLANSVLRQAPSAQVQATLVPVLTAKLDQVQAAASLPGTAHAPPASAVHGGASASTAVAPSRAVGPAMPIGKQKEIATIAQQLQDTDVKLPAVSHVALAKAYAVLGEPRKAQANIEAARRIDPDIRINDAALHAAKPGDHP